MTTEAPSGRRERKKAATRQAIADAALRLFLEHGYDAVSTRQVAEAADVSSATLFKHFATKEALVFDEDSDRESDLVAAVRHRPEGQGVIDALHDHVVSHWLPRAADPQLARFQALVESSPALRNYSDRMWARHAGSLGAAVAEQVGAEPDDLACAALARFVLEIPALTRGRADRRSDVDTLFALFARGWGSLEAPAPTFRHADDHQA